MKDIMEITCWAIGHQWVEWMHNSGLPRSYFKGNTVILKHPYCNRCGITKKD